MAARAASRLASFPLIALFVLAPLIAILAPRAHGSVPLILTVVALAGQIWRDRATPPIAWIGLVAAAGFVALIALSAIWTVEPSYTLERSGKLAYLGAAGFVLVALVRAAPDFVRRRLEQALMIGFVIGLALLIVELASANAVYRLVSLTPPDEAVPDFTTNRAAVALALFAAPALVGIQRRHGGPAALLLLAATVAAVTLSASQSAPLALAAAVLAWGAGRLAGRPTVLAIAGVAILALALAPWIMLAVPSVDLSGLPAWEAGSAALRLEIWGTVADLVVQRPWFGHGVEALRFMTLDEPIGDASTMTTIHHPHNVPLQIWIELGALGVAAAMTLVCMIARVLLGLDRDSIPVASAVVAGILATSLVSHGAWQSWWIGLIGVLAATIALTAERRTAARPVSAAVPAPSPATRRATA
ncbi:MAG: O-antigen ligase family protein [Azospirillaceae bacterium]